MTTRQVPEFTEVPAPKNLTGAERQAKYAQTDKGRGSRERYLSSPKGQAKKRRHIQRRSQMAPLRRPFIGWDGEGVTDPATGIHRYVLMANSLGESIENPGGLPMADCFDFLIRTAAANPDAINVIYGGSYDVNMMLGDLQRRELRDVYTLRYANVRGYRLSWRSGKEFYVSNGEESCRLYDVVSFFQCPFVKACDDYLGDKFISRGLVVENKAIRATFTNDDIAEVRRYNDAELANLVLLMTELRQRLWNVGLLPGRWNGPGAVAAKLLAREKIRAHLDRDIPEPVAQAARFAYAGGRFEVIRWGHVDAPAYEYDINSAYPAAMTSLPSLAGGKWKHHRFSDAAGYHPQNRSQRVDPHVEPFALYRVSWQGWPAFEPGPLFRRDSNGTVCYPQACAGGWYWGVEVAAALRYLYRYAEVWSSNPSLTIHEGWVFHPRTHVKPFSFVPGLYAKRKALKKARDGSHVGIKLGLNSLYGKMAQQVGWSLKADGTPRIPPYHQLEWAGYVTAYARALVLDVAAANPDSIIAFETDAIFSSVPLDVPIGSNLGEFEVTEFSSLTYVQSGCYAGILADGSDIVKSRGFDRGDVTRDRIVEALRNGDAKLPAQLTRFVGAGQALAWGDNGWRKWRRWITQPKELTLHPTGKRVHEPCYMCSDDGPLRLQVWHPTVCPMMSREPSHEYPVEWINPNPNMTELSEFRLEGYEQWEEG